MKQSKSTGGLKPMGASVNRKIEKAWDASPREYVTSGHRAEDRRRQVYTGTRKFR